MAPRKIAEHVTYELNVVVESLRLVSRLMSLFTDTLDTAEQVNNIAW
jgi:hypothetical protein